MISCAWLEEPAQRFTAGSLPERVWFDEAIPHLSQGVSQPISEGSFCSAGAMPFDAPPNTTFRQLSLSRAHRPIETTVWVPSVCSPLCSCRLCFLLRSLVTFLQFPPRPALPHTTHSLGQHQQPPHHIAIEARRQHFDSATSRFSVHVSSEGVFSHSFSQHYCFDQEVRGVVVSGLKRSLHSRQHLL